MNTADSAQEDFITLHGMRVTGEYSPNLQYCAVYKSPNHTPHPTRP